MKPHFGQSDAAMNKLAGINQLPNNNKPADLLKLRDVPCSCIPCKHYETPIDEIPCKYCRDHTKFEENYVIAAHKTPKRISPISYENGFEDGYEKAKKEYSVSMSGEMYVTEENMTPEPLPEGYYGHHNGCDCAVCEDMHMTELAKQRVDVEWNKLLDEYKDATLRIAELERELEKWQNGSKKQADRITQLEELFQKETLMHHAAHQRAEAAEEQLKKYENQLVLAERNCRATTKKYKARLAKYEGCVEVKGMVFDSHEAQVIQIPAVFTVHTPVTVWVKRRTE